MKSISVRGARQHNLRDVNVVIPRDKLVVVTGPSGSGKSSLAFDTIYAEGQRRYVESLSSYARQFLQLMAKPDVDAIDGLSPAICVRQEPPSRNPRSTVGTVTEVYDYLRLLYARIGVPHSPTTGKPLEAFTAEQMIERILALPEGTKLSVLANVARGQAGNLAATIGKLRKDGFIRARIDGKVRELDEDLSLDAKKKHDLEVVVDRISVKAGVRQRVADSVELSLKTGDGRLIVLLESGEEWLLSERYECPESGFVMPPLEPRLFSFNSPDGACPTCGGLGETRQFGVERVIPDPALSIADGAVAPWGKAGGPYHRMMQDKLVKTTKVDVDVPWKKLAPKLRSRILDGDDKYEGVVPGLTRRLNEYERRRREMGGSDESIFEHIESEIDRFAVRATCPDCHGTRLRPTALAVRVGGVSIGELCGRPIGALPAFFDGIKLGKQQTEIAKPVLRELASRAGFLVAVGLDYLTLLRATATLSGGESQRVSLATQIGANLSGVLYVLDEPSIGLHARDTAQLLRTLETLRERGNTVLVVEHDADIIRAADHVVDLGPGAGALGGRVVAEGTLADVLRSDESMTAQYMRGDRRIDPPATHPNATSVIAIRHATAHNLKNVDVDIPLGQFVCITGVSGSGKSSLIMDTLLPATRGEPIAGEVTGLEHVPRILPIDASPIGRSPRSNAATYLGVFGTIRELYAGLPDARARGYTASRFSFNVKGGRCEGCQGAGVVRIPMHFLPDSFVTCEQCAGKRYNRETLEVRYRGLNIAEALELTVTDAAEFFTAIPAVRGPLTVLHEVGLGYLQLGQGAPTLSGGEAQRLKLATELGRRNDTRTLYLLDEPTTGLHFHDVAILVAVLRRLVDAGHSVVVIEHNLDLIAAADHVIDLGPEGGDAGGRVLASGPPAKVAKVASSHTGRYLKETLARRGANR